MLNFTPITFDIKTLVDSYTFKYGEGSCQHSFVTSFGLCGKYGDMFCEHDNFLYTLRSKKCTENERVYLFPHGDRNNIKQALQNIFDDAHENNSRVKFDTLTENAKNLVCELFPGKFSVESNRDYSEYIYSCSRLSELPGHSMLRMRNYISHFEKLYSGRYRAEKINLSYIPAMLEFQSKWFSRKMQEKINDPVFISQIEGENEAIKIELDNFEQLELSGVVIFIDENLCAFAFGSKLSEKFFDIVAEKGLIEIANIYPMLMHCLIKICCKNYEWINFEEDIGVQGLRTMKLHYKPDFMIEKFVLREI